MTNPEDSITGGQTDEDRRRAERERKRKWRRANPEKERALKNLYRERHPEKVRACARRYVRAHPEKNAENQRRWQARHRQQEIQAYRTPTAARIGTIDAAATQPTDRREILDMMVGEYIAAIYDGTAICTASALIGTGCTDTDIEPPFSHHAPDHDREQ